MSTDFYRENFEVSEKGCQLADLIEQGNQNPHRSRYLPLKLMRYSPKALQNHFQHLSYVWHC